MNLTHEYMHHRTGYRLGAGCCWIRIYKGAECDAPVVVWPCVIACAVRNSHPKWPPT